MEECLCLGEVGRYVADEWGAVSNRGRVLGRHRDAW